MYGSCQIDFPDSSTHKHSRDKQTSVHECILVPSPNLPRDGPQKYLLYLASAVERTDV